MKDPSVYLTHILRCIRRIEEYVGADRESFFNSRLVQDAVLRNLQTMAESTRRLGEDLKGRHPEVDWSAISGFRNVLVHDYLGIDIDRVFSSIEEQMPVLKAAI